MSIENDIKNAIAVEREALNALVHKVNEQTVSAVEILLSCRGRVIVTGMGKAGLVGRKIAATFSSTGTPAFFLHPAEALHGDLGIVTDEDVVLIVSSSGNTDEVTRLLPSFKRLQTKIISLTGNTKSSLAQHSDLVIDVGVEKEADPLGVAPTSSTTAMLAMGDALAVALISRRGFTREQFSIFHPGGSLGKKLLLQVKDLMHTGDKVPVVTKEVNVREAIVEMSLKSLGVTFIVNDEGKLQGIFTDGDLRRLLQKESNPLMFSIFEVMIKNPRNIKQDALAAEAIKLMEDNSITVLPVVDDHCKPIGAIHLHDLVSSGLA